MFIHNFSDILPNTKLTLNMKEKEVKEKNSEMVYFHVLGNIFKCLANWDDLILSLANISKKNSTN